MAELVLDVVETNEENVAFARVLREWLARSGIEDCESVVIVTMRPEGFDLLQIGHRTMSSAEICRYMSWVARQVEGYR